MAGGNTGVGAAGGKPVGVGEVGVLAVGLAFRGSLVLLDLLLRALDGEDRTSLPRDWDILPGLSQDPLPLESRLPGLGGSSGREPVRSWCWHSLSSSSCHDWA